jgi:amidase
MPGALQIREHGLRRFGTSLAGVVLAVLGCGSPSTPSAGTVSPAGESGMAESGGATSSAGSAGQAVVPELGPAADGSTPTSGEAGARPAGLAPDSPARPQAVRLSLVEATLPELEQALGTGLVTASRLTELYLARIAAYDGKGPALNAFLQLNPSALDQARALDAECADPAQRRPLCGVPVVLKDNIDTADLPTTAGSVALAGSLPEADAFLVRKLRDAGAIVLGKATLTEFANFLTRNMPSGYSSLGGFGLNPYDPRPLPGGDGRPVLDPGGSSSGSSIAVSANLAAVGIGTETSGSILSPASANGIVGIKPTLGLVSRTGVIPISADQDTAGPLARSVADAARLLGVLAGFDPADSATALCQQPNTCYADYTQFLDPEALAGAHIAVPPFPMARQEVLEGAIALLTAQGATVERIAAVTTDRGNSCTASPPNVRCSTVLLYGFKRGLNIYLDATPRAPVRSLADIISFNAATPGALVYGQTLAVAANALDVEPGSPDSARYQADRAADLAAARAVLDAVYLGADGEAGTADDVDALLYSESLGAAVPAVAGYPSITVPGGFVAPADPVAHPFPSGVTFSGPRFSEPRLIALAYAFEQATHVRRPPASTPALAEDVIEP